MEVVCGGWLGVVALALLARALWAASRAVADWKPRPRSKPLPPPAPAPTRAERMAAAKARHDATVALLEASGLDPDELDAGRQHAKQRYLKELDGLMT